MNNPALFKYLLPLVLSSLMVLKTDAQVDLSWVRTFGANYEDEAESMVIDNSGNIYITGYFSDLIDFDPGPGYAPMSPISSEDVFILKLDSNGNYIWARSFGGNGRDYGRKIILDNNGDLFVVGEFRETVDFDFGSGIDNRTAVRFSDIFVQKIDANGNFLWARNYGGTNHEYVSDIEVDQFGNLYIAGNFKDTVDFDPGIGTFKLKGEGTFGSNYILKLSGAGSFIWVKQIRHIPSLFSASDPDEINDIEIDANGNIYAVGNYEDIVDFDPGPGVYRDTSDNGGQDLFLLKLDNNGNFVWMKTFLNRGRDKGGAVKTDGSGNIYFTGWMRRYGSPNPIDVDPGPGIKDGEIGIESVFLEKLDPNGDFLWFKPFGGSNNYNYITTGNSIAIDGMGFIYTGGVYEGTLDLDPGLAQFPLTSNGHLDYFVQKSDPAGNFIWAKSFGGTNTDKIKSLQTYNLNDLFIAGSFENSVDFNPDTTSVNILSIGREDIFIQRLGQDSCSALTIVVDSIRDLSCTVPGFMSTHARNGLNPYNYSWKTSPPVNDSSITLNTSGNFEIEVSDSLNCKYSRTFRITGPASSTAYDLNANLVNSPLRSGFSSFIWLDGFNDGCIPTSGTMTLILPDTNVIYDSAISIPDNVSGDTLQWNFSNLTFDSLHAKSKIFITVRSSARIGDTLCFKLMITPKTNDQDTTNNFKEYCLPVLNAYDPNDKKVFPSGQCFNNYVHKDYPLTYTIRFQNTGNYAAQNVFILDTISQFLDFKTIRVIGKSHQMYTEVLDSNVLKFYFEEINLPEANTNESLSHGYIIFEVYPYDTLPDGTIVNNRASIYFDYNEPIHTNQSFNTLVDSIPVSQTIDTIIACYSYEWVNGMTYYENNSSAKFVFESGASNGCDSIVSLHLVVNKADTGRDHINACQSYKWIDGNIYEFSNDTSLYTIENGAENGCDSTVRLNLNITRIDTTLIVDGTELKVNQLGATYQWLDCSNGFQTVPGENNLSFIAITNGSFASEIQLNNCIDTTRCAEILGIGIENTSSHNSVEIFPNPTSGLITIDFKIQRDASIRVLNLKGQVIHTVNDIEDRYYQFNLESNPGLYLVEILSQDLVQYIKIIKE